MQFYLYWERIGIQNGYARLIENGRDIQDTALFNVRCNEHSKHLSGAPPTKTLIVLILGVPQILTIPKMVTSTLVPDIRNSFSLANDRQFGYVPMIFLSIIKSSSHLSTPFHSEHLITPEHSLAATGPPILLLQMQGCLLPIYQSEKSIQEREAQTSNPCSPAPRFRDQVFTLSYVGIRTL